MPTVTATITTAIATATLAATLAAALAAAQAADVVVAAALAAADLSAAALSAAALAAADLAAAALAAAALAAARPRSRRPRSRRPRSPTATHAARTMSPRRRRTGHVHGPEVSQVSTVSSKVSSSLPWRPGAMPGAPVAPGRLVSVFSFLPRSTWREGPTLRKKSP